jgi:uroporphyrinogen III methyltransferase / synthase
MQDISVGKVYLVGAGPGDPGLITLRGVECLRQADLVLYDYLVNPEILDHARATAELVCLGRHGRGRIMSPAEVNERMIRGAQAGQTVVRLKSGDSLIFARAAEERQALAAAGLPFEIVPGITAALAAGSYAGIPLTDRDAASAVALVTGHEDDEKPSRPLDYAALAAFPGTLVFYMGVTSAPHWTRSLIDAGKAADTPAAIVRRCSWPDQVTFRCTLSRVADELAAHGMRPPVIVIVGDVAAAEPAARWFTDRPLFGQRVLVTRPAGQADDLRHRLAALGAEVLLQPAIEIADPPDWSPVDAALAGMAQNGPNQIGTAHYDWLVFSSANGVRYLLDRLLETGGDVRRLGGVRLAAIGPGTAEELAHYHLRADLVPGEFRAESLAEALSAAAAGKRFLLARASRGREVLADQLRDAGAAVDQVVVYTSRDVSRAEPAVAELLAAGRIDWITVTSSAIARSLVAMFGQPQASDLKGAKLASISPVTSATLRDLGYEPAAEAHEYTMAGLVEAMLQAKD